MIKDVFLLLNRHVKTGTNINKEYNLLFTDNTASKYSVINEIKEINKNFYIEDSLRFNDVTLNIYLMDIHHYIHY